MSKYYSTTIRIISIITLMAFVCTQTALGYEGNLRLEQPDKSPVGPTLAQALGGEFRQIEIAEPAQAAGGETVAYANGNFPQASEDGIDTVFIDVGGVILNCDYGIAAERLTKYCDFPKDEIFNNGILSPDFMIPFETGIMPPKKYFAKFKRKFKLKGLRQDEFFGIFKEIYSVNDNVVEAMRRLKESGYKLYIISNTNPVHKEYLTATSPYKGIFDMTEGFVASCEVGVMKDDPKIFYEALSVAGIEGHPERAIFIDDIGKYINLAITLKIKSIQMKPTTDLTSVLKETIEEYLADL